MEPQNISCTCISPINIAIVKYWGKKSVEQNIPLNSSFSVTLDTEQLFTKTTVDLLTNRKKKNSILIVNGQNIRIDQHSKITKAINSAKKFGLACPVRIDSINSFPASAGLASSSSAFCAFACALGRLLNLNSTDIDVVARIGSGSSCRSLYGGFVEWNDGSDPSDPEIVARQVFPHDQWPELRCIVVQVSGASKSVSSSIAMQRSAETSELLRLKTCDNLPRKRIESLKDAISERNFTKFALIAMKESNTLHAVCLDTFPPIEPPYMSAISHKIVHFVHTLNTFSNRVVCGYTFDAGPNAFIFLLDTDVKLFLSFFLTIFPKKMDNDSNFTRLINDYKIKTPCKSYELLNMEIDPAFGFETLYLCKVGAGPIFSD